MLLIEQGKCNRVEKTQPDPVLTRKKKFEFQNPKSNGGQSTASRAPQETTWKSKYSIEEKGKWIDTGSSKNVRKRRSPKVKWLWRPKKKLSPIKLTRPEILLGGVLGSGLGPSTPYKEVIENRGEEKRDFILDKGSDRENLEDREDVSAQNEILDHETMNLSNQDDIGEEERIPLAMVVADEAQSENLNGTSVSNS